MSDINTRDTHHTLNMIDNYIYMYHTKTWVILPTYPENITDSTGVTYASSQPLSRSAPIYSYSYSGPRSITFTFSFHRDMMNMINYQSSNIDFESNEISMGDDYVDVLIKQIQAMALPEYNASEKMVNPPMVAVRIGGDIFIKGVVTGSVQTSYGLPIIEVNGKDKYALCSVVFTVNEVEPYSASDVMKDGGFRGLSKSLERGLWKTTR